jgi:hypothetical protein
VTEVSDWFEYVAESGSADRSTGFFLAYHSAVGLLGCPFGQREKMRVYHFLDSTFGLVNVRNRRLKVSLFDSVNDPFELLCHNLGDKELRRRMGLFKAHTAAGSGMICFSKSMNSPVQWAHYAERHKGICLGFEVPDQFLEEVRYVFERVDFRRGAPWHAVVDDRVKQFLLTKYDHWSYEQEVRMFGELKATDNSGLFFQPFSENMVLKEIIVGFASTITRRDVDLALGDLIGTVTSFKVRPAFQEFKMVRNKSVKW